MSDAGGMQTNNGFKPETPKSGFFGLTAISDMASAKRAARRGSYGGACFSVMELIGAAFLFMGYSPDDGSYIGANTAMFYLLVSEGIVLLLAIFMTWRVWTGRGYISAVILPLWFILEIFMKLRTGWFSGGWLIAYFGIFFLMIDGIRGTWRVREYRKLGYDEAIKAIVDQF